VRNALVYILFNHRKHHAPSRVAGAAGGATPEPAPALDPCSSAWWFRDWAPWDHPPRELLVGHGDAPTVNAETWLASFGWRWAFGRNRDGRVRFSESPRASLAPRAARPPRT
jgi:hypothetical protein